MSEPRTMKLWATWLRGGYGEFSPDPAEAVKRTVAAGGQGWSWERMRSVGWELVPVTIVPGHGEKS